MKKTIKLCKKFIACILCIVISCGFISCSKNQIGSVRALSYEEASSIEAATDKVDNKWLYKGYWLYAPGGGEGGDVFVFHFLDNKYFEFASFYSVTENTFDSEPAFTKEKYIHSKDRKFGLFIGNDWHFAFDSDKGKLYVRTDEVLYDEVLNYNKVTDANLKKCCKIYNTSSKYVNIEIDDSNAEYDVSDIALDYTPGKKNLNCDLSVNPAESRIAYQDGYYYYFDDNNNIKKIKENKIKKDCSPEILYSEYTQNLRYIYSIFVSGSYIYFSASDGNNKCIYAMPTSYVSEVGPIELAEIYDSKFFVADGTIYFLQGEEISASSKKITLCSINIEEYIGDKREICDVGYADNTTSIRFEGVADGYAYITKKISSSYDSMHIYSKINLSSKDVTEFSPSEEVDHIAQRIIDGKLYLLFGDVSYMVVDYENEKATRINPGAALGLYRWMVVSIMGDEAIISGKYDTSSSYNTTLDNLKKIAEYNSESFHNGVFPDTVSPNDFGFKLTDDKMMFDEVYKFNNKIFYLTGSINNKTLCKINNDGSDWVKIDHWSTDD